MRNFWAVTLTMMIYLTVPAFATEKKIAEKSQTVVHKTEKVTDQVYYPVYCSDDEYVSVEIANLCAQQDQIKASDFNQRQTGVALELSFYSLLASSILGLLSLLVAGISLYFAHKNAKAADLSAKAAMIAAESSGDMLKADRAWITIGVPEIHWTGALDAAGQPINLYFRTLVIFENTGRSPAINLRSMVALTLKPPGELFEPPILPVENEPEKVLGAGKTYVTTPADVVGDNALRVIVERADMYVVASAIYDDVFGGIGHRSSVGYKVKVDMATKPDGTGVLMNSLTALPQAMLLS